ncbi:cytochrome P450 [Artomyces pyxidatus]|uniref:Cytochrome P450 n=1 Tax=Artomyces pyxidatus TaxID=48021 RepID=A0ACB8SUR4_9AGAM|nr:cytochrome P450 [Artomyces pyxidatus]
MVACTSSVLFFLVSHRIRQIVLWKIPGPPAASFITGNYSQMFHAGANAFHEQIIRTYGRVIRTSGFLGDSQLIISDTKALMTILMKEHDIFEEADWFIECNRHAFGIGLFGTEGERHRKQRKQLNPVFSYTQMRSLTPLFEGIAHQFCDVIHTQVVDSPQEVEIYSWLSRTALELIAQGGLGYTFNSLDPNSRDNEFGKAIKEYMPTLTGLLVWRTLFPLISHWPPCFLRSGAKLIPLPKLHKLIYLSDTMRRYSKEVFDEKKALLEHGDDVFSQQLSEGKDIISVLMKCNGNASEEERLTDEEILSQMTTLLFAATDTTSSALSRILLLLSQHPDVQEKLRQELNEAFARSSSSGIDYDELLELPYLEAVCRETLRLFPPASFVSRICRADACVQLSQPVETADSPISSLFVPRGTTVLINILGVNRDPSIWGADASEWKPGRWLAPLPESVVEARIPGVYSNLLTFVGGGRACIGFKFSQLEMKVVLSQLIREFRFAPSSKEIVWRFGSVTSPSVKGSTDVGPKMPLIVERV